MFSLDTMLDLALTNTNLQTGLVGDGSNLSMDEEQDCTVVWAFNYNVKTIIVEGQITRVISLRNNVEVYSSGRQHDLIEGIKHHEASKAGKSPLIVAAIECKIVVLKQRLTEMGDFLQHMLEGGCK